MTFPTTFSLQQGHQNGCREPAISQGSLSFADGESTIAFQVPRPTKGLVHQRIFTLPHQVSFSWNVNDIPIS